MASNDENSNVERLAAIIAAAVIGELIVQVGTTGLVVIAFVLVFLLAVE